METRIDQKAGKMPSKTAVWSGRIISTLCVLFLLMDSIMRMIKESHYVEGTVKLQWPESSMVGLAIVLLISTIFYIIPRTAILGAILLTAYLGGAIASMARLGEPYWFPFIFGVLIWGGLYLRDIILRELIPLRKF
ncbi:MAG: DoxX family protein [Chitinophagaceae bacterium]